MLDKLTAELIIINTTALIQQWSFRKKYAYENTTVVDLSVRQFLTNNALCSFIETEASLMLSFGNI